jgi:RecB family exonuclease
MFEGRRAAELARHVFADAAHSGLESWSDLAARFRTLHRREFSENPGPEVEDAIAAAIAAQDDEPADAHTFARELTAALDLVKHRTPAQGVSSEGRVLLIRVDQARGFSRAVVFYPGCVAGAILPPPHEDPLLPDRLRDTLNGRHAHEGRVLPLRGAGNDEAILLLRFALECASESAVFSWSKRERTGGPLRLPAGILVDLAASRANRALDPGGADFLELVPPDAPSFARELPVDLTDLELSFVRDEEPLGEPEIARLLAEGGGRFFEPALEAVRSRWRPGQLTAHDGVLHSPQALQAVQRAREKKEHLWSPTALERALTCPFSFLVTQILGLQPPRPEQDDFTPLECGSIIHASLEEIYGALQREERLPLDPKSLPLALEKLDRSLDGEREALSLLSTAQRLARSATLAAIRQDLASLLSREAHLPEESRTVPLRFELCFGFDFEGASPALEWSLPSGRTIRLRGRIDRIDVTREGLLEVIDYKSGKIALKWGEIAGIDRERAIVTLQLALYAEAATRTIGRNVSRALLRSTSSRTPSKEAGLTREHLAQHRPAIEALLDRALDLSERGWFPSLPGKGCCRDELACACGPSPRARFLRKRGDAQLEAHLNLLRESM